MLDSYHRDSFSFPVFWLFLCFLFGFALTPASDSLRLTTQWPQGPSLLKQFMPNTVGTREAMCPVSHLSWASWARVSLVSIRGLGIVARGVRSTEGSSLYQKLDWHSAAGRSPLPPSFPSFGGHQASWTPSPVPYVEQLM